MPAGRTAGFCECDGDSFWLSCGAGDGGGSSRGRYSSCADRRSWGYTGAADADAFVKAYERLIESIYESELIFGYCYTQTTDIEHEMNGLLDEAHEFKVAPEIIKEINDRRPTSGAFMV